LGQKYAKFDQKIDGNHLIYMVQQIENHGNKHWAHYAGLVESDKR
jgi:hypothetical protein